MRALDKEQESSLEDLSDDAFLGGRLSLLQPRSGYRAGVDAVLLAAAVGPTGPDKGTVRILDAGAGVGTAGLCVAARLPHARVTLLEREPRLVALAARNIERNGLAGRVDVIAADIAARPAVHAGAGLGADAFDWVIANPPYHVEPKGTRAPDPLKARSHAMPEDGLEVWCRALCRLARPGGHALLIHKAAQLPELLAAMKGRFGDLHVLPISAHRDEPAIRVIVRGRKGSKAPLRLLANKVLHRADLGFEPWACAIFRDGAGLDLDG